MKYVWTFDVVNRPSKEKDGVTNVSQDFSISSGDAGDVVPVGSVTKPRGNASYVALNVAGDSVGTFDTRSKAAHALRKYRVANLTATDAAVEADDTDAGEGETDETTETTTRTVALDEAPEVLGITLGELTGKIQSGELKTIENDDGAKQVVIEDLGGEAA